MTLPSFPLPGETMKAGRELDAMIAEKVMGWTGRQNVRLRGRDSWSVAFQHTTDRSMGEFSVYYTEDGTKLYCGRPWTPHFAPHYSRDLSDAWLIVEKLRSDGWVYCTVQSFPSESEASEWDDSTMKVEWWAEFSRYRSPVEATSPHCDTPALAICLASLKAVELFPPRVPENKEGK